jgi:putative nucleotidyltransferase with HDIG domain
MNAFITEQGRHFYAALLEALVQGMGTAKGYLFLHGPRTAVLSHVMGSRLGLGDEELGHLFFSSVLADLGMIGLVEEEWETPVVRLAPRARAEVNSHPVRSAQATSAIPFLDGVESIIRYHHEWWDGSGYPEGLSGSEVPLLARIVRLADTVTALGEPRPQRSALSMEEIRIEVQRGAGREFDPELAQLWLDLDRANVLPSFKEDIYRELRNGAVEALVPEEVSATDNQILLNLFSTLIDAKDPYTGGHSRRVALLAGEVAEVLGMGDEFRERVETSGYLHDLGKLSVPGRILRKMGALEASERIWIESHTTAGAGLLEEVPVLRSYASGARHHHERWDGSGYPEGLSGQRIPRMARILAICDAYDAMTSARAYRSAHSHEFAEREILANAGTHFSPKEAEAFLSLPEETFRAIRGFDAEVRDSLILAHVDRPPRAVPTNGRKP